MKRSAVRKAIRAAALSLLLMTATGVAGLEMIGTGSAMAAQDTPGGDPAAQGSGTDQPPSPTQAKQAAWFRPASSRAVSSGESFDDADLHGSPGLGLTQDQVTRVSRHAGDLVWNL
jgi:hypothetical protein